MAKILLVEDNEMNRDMLSRRLVKRGYDVSIAIDGEQGVAMARSEMPALILMDMSLPGLDGWEATRQIKASPETRGIPVIAIFSSWIQLGEQPGGSELIGMLLIGIALALLSYLSIRRHEEPEPMTGQE